MKLSRRKWIFLLVALASGTALLSIGSVLLYLGAWVHLMRYGVLGTPPVEYVFMFWGSCIIIGGISVASYLGKQLNGRYLAMISVMHLVIAPSLIYVVFSILDPCNVYRFVHSINLSNVALDIAFLLGYFVRR